MEEEKASLFEADAGEVLGLLEDHVSTHLPPLSPSQIARLMEIAGAPDENSEEGMFSSLQEYARME